MKKEERQIADVVLEFEKNLGLDLTCEIISIELFKTIVLEHIDIINDFVFVLERSFSNGALKPINEQNMNVNLQNIQKKEEICLAGMYLIDSLVKTKEKDLQQIIRNAFEKDEAIVRIFCNTFQRISACNVQLKKKFLKMLKTWSFIFSYNTVLRKIEFLIQNFVSKNIPLYQFQFFNNNNSLNSVRIQYKVNPLFFRINPSLYTRFSHSNLSISQNNKLFLNKNNTISNNINNNINNNTIYPNNSFIGFPNNNFFPQQQQQQQQQQPNMFTLPGQWNIPFNQNNFLANQRNINPNPNPNINSNILLANSSTNNNINPSNNPGNVGVGGNWYIPFNQILFNSKSDDIVDENDEKENEKENKKKFENFLKFFEVFEKYFYFCEFCGLKFLNEKNLKEHQNGTFHLNNSNDEKNKTFYSRTFFLDEMGFINESNLDRKSINFVDSFETRFNYLVTKSSPSDETTQNENNNNNLNNNNISEDKQQSNPPNITTTSNNNVQSNNSSINIGNVNTNSNIGNSNNGNNGNNSSNSNNSLNNNNINNNINSSNSNINSEAKYEKIYGMDELICPVCSENLKIVHDDETDNWYYSKATRITTKDNSQVICHITCANLLK